MKQKLMMIFLVILMCFTFTIPAVNVKAATITTNQTGTDGLWYSFWTNGGGSVAMNLNGGDSYSVNWTNCGDFTCGKGWSTGSGHTVTFSGSYSNSGGGAFGIYGWTTNPLIEYYIVEKTGNGGSPASGTYMGTVTSDGSTYDIYKHQQVNQPSIQGTATFWQYISVRQSQRTSGTITIQNHFDAWKKLGMNLGTMNYQILLTEAWNGSGSASATISEGGSSPTPPSSGPSGECENMSLSGTYAAKISTPFAGAALYANNDAASATYTFNGSSSITLYGASNNSSTAQVSLYIGNSKVGTFSFTGTNETASTVNFNASGSQTFKFMVENDTGAWDAYIDRYTISGGGVIPTPTPTPTPPSGGTTIQCEDMTKSGQYAGNISSPFSGVALYANNDAASATVSFNGNASITCYGASNNSSMAQVSCYIGNNKVGTFYFTGTSETASTVSFSASGSQTVKLVVENDTGAWDAYLDYITVSGGSGGTNPTQTSGLPVPPVGANVPRPSASQGGLSVLKWAGFTSAGSFTMDDNNASVANNLSQILNTGIRLTFYIVSSWSNAGSFQSAKDAGCEIGNHSATHPSTGSGSDIDACTNYIQSTYGVKPLTFAIPNGSVSGYSGLLQSRFLLARGVNGGTISASSGDPYNLNCNIPPTGASSSTMVNYFSSARSTGGWCILLVHGFTGDGNAYQPVDLSKYLSAINTVKGYGDMWIDTVLNIGAYWRAQQMSITSSQSGSDIIYRWTLPANFPSGKYLRIKLTGGTPKQNGRVINWDSHGYYEIALDAGSLTVSP